MHTTNAPAPDASVGQLDACLAFVDAARDAGGVVLVVCSSGNNRAAAVAAAWLLHSGTVTSLDAGMERLRTARPSAAVSEAYFAQLLRFEAAKTDA